MEPPTAVSSGPGPPSSSRSTGSPAPTTHDNVVATRRFSRWLLHAVPMPPNAREWDHSPTLWYRQASLGIGPSDPTFTRTTWWTVQLTRAAFGSWLRTHTPPGLKADPHSASSAGPGGGWEEDQEFHAAGTHTHTEGWVNVAFMPCADGLAVRVDTFVGARFARTVLVPRSTTAVEIRRTERSIAGTPGTHITVRTVTDPHVVAHLVGTVDGLPGAMTARVVAPCPDITTLRTYSMTFTTSKGTYVALLPTTMCWPRLRLAHNGADAGPPLDPGRVFADTADSYLP